MKQLGEILLDEGLLTEGQLMAAIDEQLARGQSLGRTLVENGVVAVGEAALVKKRPELRKAPRDVARFDAPESHFAQTWCIGNETAAG